MTTLHVRLFGQISLQQHDRPLVDLPAKALELFCYLLLHRERAHTREALAEALWPEAVNTLSQKYLRQTLWQLQTGLAKQGTQQPTPVELILIDSGGWVRANADAICSVDVAVFEQAYSSTRDTPGPLLSLAQAQALAEAVELYQGDLLETWYQDWCIFERERLQLTYLAMLDKLMNYCAMQGCYGRGIEYGQRSLRYDSARESTYQQLMRLHYLAGDRTTALREYARCAKALAREFGVEPAAQTNALYEQIRADQRIDLPPVRVGYTQPASVTTNRAGIDLHREVVQLQANLAAFQTQLQSQLTELLNLLENHPKTSQQTE